MKRLDYYILVAEGCAHLCKSTNNPYVTNPLWKKMEKVFDFKDGFVYTAYDKYDLKTLKGSPLDKRNITLRQGRNGGWENQDLAFKE